jgi:valyl-tRNA synthetase
MSENTVLETVYDPRAVEPEIYPQWEKSGAFKATPDGSPHEKTFTIMIPLPNVTGALHLGHALNNTLQDVLIRWHRMMGDNTLWQPGTDHAGIATQAVVERRIRDLEGKSRHDLGREELVRRIWQWKDEYEQRIIGQLKLMGCSCDWDRTRFTLDEGLARAVRHLFFKMFKDGLIFRGKRLVNWDTELQTAVANDEVYYEKIKGHFWHFKYPVIDPQPGEPEHVIIATTRPETMLGDTAVAVNPDPEGVLDKREAELRADLVGATKKERVEIESKLEAIAERRTTHLEQLKTLTRMANDGRMLMLPLVEREIPLIADEWADPTLGTGCVKITPAHDPNDYEVGERHGLAMINVLSADGKVAPIIEADGSLNPHNDDYAGLPFSTAGRDKVVADLEARGLLHAIEDHEVEIGHSDRSKSAIEPYLSDQWFVRMGDVSGPGITLGDGERSPGLAQAAMETVHDGRVQVFPSRYAKSYLDWLGEKRDWCISRQLWWGHRIPIWRWEGTWDHPAWVGLLSGDDPNVSVRCVDVDRQREIPWSTAEGALARGHTYQVFVCLLENNDDLIRKLEDAGFAQDEDVLDTWFSSQLWPFSTLGWPEQTDSLKEYYPGTVLVTSRDIITNWVARMVMSGLYALGEIPFDHVYIHPKILDGRGETMSKSKGNGVDPIDVIHTHGADALRYTMADMTTETQDIRMPVEYVCPHCGALVDQGAAIKIEEQARKSRGEKLGRKIQPADCLRVKCTHKDCGQEFATQWADDGLKKELGLARETSDKFEIGRNFCNKLWNAARYAFMNLEDTPCEKIELSALLPEDRWILARLSQTIRRFHKLLGSYQFSATVKELREFFWEALCDWYIELTKPRITLDPRALARADNGETSRNTAKQVLAFCLDQVLRMWHPIIPFITERLWQQLNTIAPRRGLPGIADLVTDSQLVVADFPPAVGYPALEDEGIIRVFEEIQGVARGVRELRSRCEVSPKQSVAVTVALPEADRGAFEAQSHIVLRMANVGELKIDPHAKRPPNAGSVTIRSLRVFVHDISDDAAERERTAKALGQLEKQISGKESKLANEKFIANAPSELVEAERGRLKEMLGQRTELRAHLAELAE